MTSAGWKARLFVALVFVATQRLHAGLFSNMPITDAGQLIYHGSAALADFWLIVVGSCFLTGRLAADLESLCLASMVSNVIGWIFFTAYLPPTIYNIIVGTIGYVQLLRLFYIGRYDADHFGPSWTSGFGFDRAQLYHAKAHQ